MGLNKDLGDAHEAFLVNLFGGRQARGSGNQWRQPMDGRTSRKHLAFAFAWDGKSTMSKTVSVTLDMVRKARAQAGGHRPMIGLRWYNPIETSRLIPIEDWVAVRAQDMAEVLVEANALARIEATVESLNERNAAEMPAARGLIDEIRSILREARE